MDNYTVLLLYIYVLTLWNIDLILYIRSAVYSLWLGNLYGTVKQHNIEYRLRAQTI